MKTCPMLEQGEAYKLHLPQEIGEKIQTDYNQKQGLVFCEIKEGKCPYRNEGERMIYMDAEINIVCNCESRGLN